MRRLAASLLPLFSLALAGCGSNVPPETDSAKAREQLTTTLNAWVKGSTPAEQKPVVVVDPDWEEGLKLTKYAIEPTETRSGVDPVFKVKLTLQKKDGGTAEKTVNFAVGISPTQTVVLRYQ